MIYATFLFAIIMWRVFQVVFNLHIRSHEHRLVSAESQQNDSLEIIANVGILKRYLVSSNTIDRDKQRKGY